MRGFVIKVKKVKGHIKGLRGIFPEMECAIKWLSFSVNTNQMSSPADPRISALGQESGPSK